MKRNSAALGADTFDLFIIGGGIVGAGIARDAAQRGLRVALVDRGDFAGETSSRSSKLIHGGFRYLEHGAFHLVAESCRERAILLRIAPHLVHPVPFLLPVYKNGPRSLLTLRIGMTLYDLLALYRNTAPHKTLNAEATLAAEPGLRSEGLLGAIRYYDCAEDDARFCVANVLHAADLGAVCCNYCPVVSMDRDADRISAIHLHDTISGTEITARAKVIVNAAGPWVEQVSAMGKLDGQHSLKLSPTKGVHLLMPALTQKHAITLQSRDRRILFIIPWQDCSIVGTTDTNYSDDAGTARATPEDIAYLFEQLDSTLQHRVNRGDLITTFAGVRPLLAADAKHPSARSREHRIIRQGDNLISVAGGKYTTYRAIAQQTVDHVYTVLGQKSPPCRTAHEIIPARLRAPFGAVLCEHPKVFESEIATAVRDEMATSVADVMFRRTGLALSKCGGEATARRVAAIMARELNWDGRAEESSLASYLGLLTRAKSV
jgi:glycerol-3-phosphate dehydrogenase